MDPRVSQQGRPDELPRMGMKKVKWVFQVPRKAKAMGGWGLLWSSVEWSQRALPSHELAHDRGVAWDSGLSGLELGHSWQTEMVGCPMICGLEQVASSLSINFIVGDIVSSAH